MWASSRVLTKTKVGPGVGLGGVDMVLPLVAALGPVRPHALLVQLPEGLGVLSTNPKDDVSKSLRRCRKPRNSVLKMSRQDQD